MKQLSVYRKPKDPGYVGGFYWPPTIVGFIGLFLTNVVATQFVAWRFEFQPALGPALTRIGSFSLYAPYNGSSGCGQRQARRIFELSFHS